MLQSKAGLVLFPSNLIFLSTLRVVYLESGGQEIFAGWPSQHLSLLALFLPLYIVLFDPGRSQRVLLAELLANPCTVLCVCAQPLAVALAGGSTPRTASNKMQPAL